jgi:5'-nucleotidase (lipoprotein e(P4) family)
MKKFTISLLITLPLLSSNVAFSAEQDTVCKEKEYNMALRYQQQSAEVMALQLQAYQFATQRFIQLLANHHSDKKPAVVLDLDETVIDNTPLLVRDVNNCHDYTSWDTWSDWEQKGEPTLIPGAKDFIDFVTQQGVKIYYISDRFQENKADTLKTLKKLNVAQVSSDNVLLYTESKEARRDIVRKEHDILMLIGDSLHDFAAEFKNKKSTEYQRGLVAKEAAHFGNDWIVMPNASYGSWSKSELKTWNENAAK